MKQFPRMTRKDRKAATEKFNERQNQTIQAHLGRLYQGSAVTQKTLLSLIDALKAKGLITDEDIEKAAGGEA